jgi:hypothetical protein
MSARDFGPDDYEQLLALDEAAGVHKKGITKAELDAHTTVAVAEGSGRLRGGTSGADAIALDDDDDAQKQRLASQEEERRHGDDGPWECAICLEVPTSGQAVRRLRCLHTFHLACVDTWLATNRNCPVCKLAVAPSPVQQGRPGHAAAGGRRR